MPALPADLRAEFERHVIAARSLAEQAALAALSTLAVERDAFFPTMNDDQKRLRRALRARARQLGSGDLSAGLPRLREEIAYEQWHRMLFTRFLAENHLLLHPTGVPVTLDECAELAREEGAADKWDLAARYAAAMLPGIFLLDDPAVNIRFAPEWRHRLEKIVADLPRLVFTADDGLGWAYQFWQSQKKAEVNASGRKIGGADIAPVTQLFTEDYMVKFMLHNSLGAWWAARHPDSPLVATFDYLRWRDAAPTDHSPLTTDHSPLIPAAGTFPGWPDKAAAVTMMDPCGGSGHFIVAGFEMLAQMRMEEEGLSAAAAGDAVIRDNLFMLELDPRCTQIAAFNLALTAWKAGGYRPLPLPHIACSGIPVTGQLEDWLKLAKGDYGLEITLRRLYTLFQNAPDLGSLINPSDIPVEDRMFVGDYQRVVPLLEQALMKEQETDDPAAKLFGAALAGITRAVRLLGKKYTLAITNVPYLQRGKHSKVLMAFANTTYPVSKHNLATMFLERCRQFTLDQGTYILVIAQEYLFQPAYEGLRREFLANQTLEHLSVLGPRAFETIGGEVVNVVLTILTRTSPNTSSSFTALDTSSALTPSDKQERLKHSTLIISKAPRKNKLSICA